MLDFAFRGNRGALDAPVPSPVNSRAQLLLVPRGVAVHWVAGNVPLNVPERSANVMVFWDPARMWEARAVMQVVGRRFADNTNTAASIMPSYKVVDFGVRWRPRPRLVVDARLDNVFDQLYADSGTTTQWLLGSPRSFTVSLNVLF